MPTATVAAQTESALCSSGHLDGHPGSSLSRTKSCGPHGISTVQRMLCPPLIFIKPLCSAPDKAHLIVNSRYGSTIRKQRCTVSTHTGSTTPWASRPQRPLLTESTASLNGRSGRAHPCAHSIETSCNIALSSSTVLRMTVLDSNLPVRTALLQTVGTPSTALTRAQTDHHLLPPACLSTYCQQGSPHIWRDGEQEACYHMLSAAPNGDRTTGSQLPVAGSKERPSGSGTASHGPRQLRGSTQGEGAVTPS
jgi:hypothetical protein